MTGRKVLRKQESRSQKSRKPLVDNTWKAVKRIGAGGYEQVFEAVNVNNFHERAAIKMEEKRSGHTPSLQAEYEFYKSANLYNCFPHLYYYGENHSGTHKTLVMDLLGPSLRDLFCNHSRRFSTKTVLMIALQGMARIKAIHDLGFVHGDIKPENILIGRSDRERIYVADFGCARRFKTSAHGHIPYSTGHRFAGTLLFASINVHRGIQMSRRDDLESFGYTLVELFKGSLPWTGTPGFTSARQHKQRTSISKLCENLTSAMDDYFKHVGGLEFAEKPDYSFLERGFRKALESRGLRDDRRFDWI